MEDKDVVEELTSWEFIQSPSNNNDKLPVTQDDFFGGTSVFPPTNHEDLRVITTQGDVELQDPEPYVSSSSSVSSLSGDDVNEIGEIEQVEGKVQKLKNRLNLGILHSGVTWFACRIRRYAVCKVGLLFFAWGATGFAAVMLGSLLKKRVVKWRKQMELNSDHHLIFLIKEKDQKLNQLLVQIAQMNESLLARRRVPVIHVN